MGVMTEPAPILLLGDARLRVRSSAVERFDDPALQRDLATLAATLEAFRKACGFGRAISAPQIGIPRRFIAANLGRGTFFVVNPVVTSRSTSTFSMWDDCMSFPDLLVRVMRHESISLSYSDERGGGKTWSELDVPAAELLQHEIDHLDGILAVDRAIDRDSLVLKSVFDADREHFASLADYTIAGGMRPGRVSS